MQPNLLLFVFGLISIIGKLDAKVVKQNELQPTDASPPTSDHQAATAFDYDYGTTPRRYSTSAQRHQYKSKSIATTTPRPFVSYWQNLMRNVRLPVPSITWNVTNPLANLFNAGVEEYAPIEEVVDDYYVGSSSQRRQQTKKRRKPHNKRHRKHKRPQDHTTIEQQPQQLELPNSAPQMLLQEYPINSKVDLNSPMYFYDPNTDAYYAVQRVRALGAYMEGTVFNPKPTNEIQENIKQPQTAQSSSEVTINDDDEDDINLDEAEEIDLDKVARKESTVAAVDGEQQIDDLEKKKNDFINEEALRNVLGTFMRDDLHNRQKQRSKEKKNLNGYKQIKPRKRLNHYFLLDVN